jgi:hypothetical protein
VTQPITIEMSPTREAYRAGMARLYELGLQQVLGNDPERIDHNTGEVVERRYRVSFEEVIPDRTVLQNAFYWAAVLKQISEQAPGNWTPDAWHEAFKRTELGYEVMRVKVAGRKKPTVYRRLKSTTDLTVKQFSDYLDRVIASATTALGVTFEFRADEREAVRYRRPARKVKAQQGEVVEA